MLFLRQMGRPILRYALLAIISVVVLFAILPQRSWRLLGLESPYGSSQEGTESGKNILSDSWIGKPVVPNPHAWREGGDGQFKEPKVDSMSPYPVGKTKPAGSNYTKCLVMPKMKGEDTSWIEQELGDMVESGLLTTAMYAMDNPSAPLHPVKNKGNEVMAYLSYIIDSYEHLPDVSIFMHSHRLAWHNNLILDEDAALMVRHLSPERVTREGYMNLRCHWEPGCPDWLRPADKKKIPDREEQEILAESWAELYPGDEIPTVLAQPCCAQFAVSRERILAIPKERFIWLRDWVIRTNLPDFLAGRVFEYTWQYVFTASPLHCPSMSACYCDGYGLCFGDPQKFDYYFELNFNLNKYKDELNHWHEKAAKAALAREKASAGKVREDELLEIPEVGRDTWLKEEIEKIDQEIKGRRRAAFELGKDPRQRAKEAGRMWKEGDGF